MGAIGDGTETQSKLHPLFWLSVIQLPISPAHTVHFHTKIQTKSDMKLMYLLSERQITMSIYLQNSYENTLANIFVCICRCLIKLRLPEVRLEGCGKNIVKRCLKTHSILIFLQSY